VLPLLAPGASTAPGGAGSRHGTGRIVTISSGLGKAGGFPPRVLALPDPAPSPATRACRRREGTAAVAMTTEELVRRTRAALAERARRTVPPGALIRAAVLVPIVDRGEPYLLFAKRTDRVGHHRGQISFPGGALDPTDETMEDAALRECEEEVALPRDAVEVLGALDDTETFATRFVITPFVGIVRAPVAWRPDGEEIEKVIEVPYAALVAPGGFRLEPWTRDGVTRPVHFFDWQGETIWGATARILKHYLELLEERA
jgi:8-oxo-dGTP pyrophosphatase MutT (NUDIX family)